MKFIAGDLDAAGTQSNLVKTRSGAQQEISHLFLSLAVQWCAVQVVARLLQLPQRAVATATYIGVVCPDGGDHAHRWDRGLTALHLGHRDPFRRGMRRNSAMLSLCDCKR